MTFLNLWVDFLSLTFIGGKQNCRKYYKPGLNKIRLPYKIAGL